MPDKVSIHNPLVSIITPSYNQGQFIEETILSVLNQNYPNIEYIVIDGGSTDNTLDILKKYDARIKWLSEKDQGQADAVNKGFKMANGEIIGWLNSDDTYEPECFKKVVEKFLVHPETVLVYGNGFQMNTDGSLKIPFKSGSVTYKKLSKKNPLLQPSIFFRKEVLSKVGYLDIHYQYVMDYEFWVRIFKKYEHQTAYLPVYLSSWRLHGEAKTSRSRGKIYDEIFEVLMRYYKKISSSWMVWYIAEILLGYNSNKGIKYFILRQKWPLISSLRILIQRFGYFKAMVYFLRFGIELPFLLMFQIFFKKFMGFKFK